jgi:hypothetical protein
LVDLETFDEVMTIKGGDEPDGMAFVTPGPHKH